MTNLGDMEDDASLMDDLMFSRRGDYSNDALRVVYDADSDNLGLSREMTILSNSIVGLESSATIFRR
ncbi:unnamed protein product [Brassica oleracea]